MKALLKEGSSIAVRKRPVPTIGSDGDVLVRVAVAGLCRTDLYAARGVIPVADPVVLGHEMSGVVESVGAGVETVAPGQHVTVNPLVSCGSCPLCAAGETQRCQDASFLGVDSNGAFAEFALVPQRLAIPLADDIPFLAAAYAEPVAAALAVLKTGIRPSDTGLIIGDNRFSRLTERVLATHGFRDVKVWSPRLNGGREPEPSSYDFVIETVATDETLRTMVRAVRPGGALILKSRQPSPLTISVLEMIRKEPVVYPVNYGSFDDAVRFIAGYGSMVEDLVDGVYELEEFESVFARAEAHEQLKPFFSLCS